MKVTVEGTTEEMLEAAELIAYGGAYRNSTRVPKDTDASQRDGRLSASNETEIPNRFREEGV